MASDSSWDVGQQAAEILAPGVERDRTRTGHRGHRGFAHRRRWARAARNPGLMLKAAATLTGGLSAIPSTVLTDWISAPKQAKDSKQGDRRFSDPAWTENPYFHAVLLAYLSGCDFARTLVSESGLDHKRATKAQARARADAGRGGTEQLSAHESDGAQARVRHRRREPAQGGAQLHLRSDPEPGHAAAGRYEPFELGRNMAVTPSKVVFRNELMELLQYEPQTDKVHEVPAAVQPAVDQQVLHHGPGAPAQLHRMGGPARPDSVRDQLSQPDRRDGPHHDGRLPDLRTAAGTRRHHRRSPARRRSTWSACASVAR